jgi:hypothetical protein
MATERGRDLRGLVIDERDGLELGALLELHYLQRAHARFPDLLATLRTALPATLRRAIVATPVRPAYATDRRIGVIRLGPQNDSEIALHLKHFYLSAQRAAELSRLPKRLAQGLVGAVAEIEDNVHDHSGRPRTGLVAYRSVADGVFEFVVGDAGIGVLRSLQASGHYRGLTDSGHAMRVALSDGGTRYGPASGHGTGFRPLFTALMNRHGNLRFRSGDHVLLMSGNSPSLASVVVAQRAAARGFVVSVTCSLPAALLVPR